MKTRIYLIRHGESKGNVLNIFQGWKDFDLTSNGIKQAEKLAEFMKNIDIDFFYSSSLKRAFHTASIIAQKHGMSVIKKEEFKELNCGKWHGLTRQQAEQISPEQIYNFLYDPENLSVPGGETILELQKRALKGINDLREKHLNKKICLVAHGFINKVILCSLMGKSLKKLWDFPQHNTAVNIIDFFEDESVEIVDVNNTKHLY